MEKFSQLKYVRPDMEAAKGEMKACLKAMKAAGSYEEMRSLFLEQKEKEYKRSTMETIASIRNTIDTNDEFYDKEMKYINQEGPLLGLLRQELEKVILECPFRSQWEEEFGSFFIKSMEVNQKLSDPAIVKDLVEESGLTQRYSKVSAAASVEFRGETCNFYGLLKHMQSTDRQERKEAMAAWGDLYEKIAPDLDQIYDRMVALRSSMAKKLGFDSYIDFIYLARGRYDYGPGDVAKFRRQVREVIVPVCQRLREEQAARLGVDKLCYYDEALVFPEGNAVPEGNREELVDKARKMYRELSPETGEFFDFMADHDMFDLETKKGKRGGGYCTFLPAYKSPFIFANFNGTNADVNVLTHEAGHAFESYTAARNIKLMDMVFSSYEVAEIHSMSMEYFTHPWMELFFGGKADRYLYSHVMEALEAVPYMVCVDEFQHKVFENPSMTAMDRRGVWKELERVYLPWRDYDGHKFLEEGGFWMQKQHIFLFPFYYIDYALAQMGAFEFYGRMKKDRDQAWKDYYRLCQAGGSRGYFDLLELAGLHSPFEEGTVKKIIADLQEDLFD
ncbi:MAG: M3 family oligoendopeptidase [Hungatella sp.]|jgi:M3 family oligoendopeptidase|nr:M3 family oligoendopeptidase [Hungatella sp.]